MDLLTIALLVILAYISMRRIHRRFFTEPCSRARNLPPGPNPIPIIGNLHQLGDKPHKSLAKLAKIHGPIMSLKLGQVTAIVASSSKIAREILQTHDASLSSRTIPDALHVHGHNLVGLPWIPVSPLWRAMRKICNTQLFAPKALDSTLELRRRKVRDFVRRVGTKDEADLGAEAFSATLNLLSNTVFSVDFADPESELAREFLDVTRNLMREAGTPNIADYFPAIKWVDPQGFRRRMGRHFRRILGLFGDMVDQRVRLRNNIRVCDVDMNGDRDVLDTLLDIVEESQEINSHQMLHLLLVLFVAGTDTTATTVQWAMAELLRNPNVLSKAKVELNEVIGKGNMVEESDISRLTYLQAIVKETFRLHPAAPLLLPRKSEADVEIDGFLVPKGSQVLVNVWAIGRDPSLWDDPEEFRPERFLGSEIDVRGTTFEVLPFGAGRRICPGLPLAMRMLHLMLGTLVHSFDWRLIEDGVDMEDKFGLSLDMAKPLRAIPTLIT